MMSIFQGRTIGSIRELLIQTDAEHPPRFARPVCDGLHLIAFLHEVFLKPRNRDALQRAVAHRLHVGGVPLVEDVQGQDGTLFSDSHFS